MSRSTTLYKRDRFPPEIIQNAVWLYHRFNLSHRDIEDLLAEGGVGGELLIIAVNPHYSVIRHKQASSISQDDLGWASPRLMLFLILKSSERLIDTLAYSAFAGVSPMAHRVRRRFYALSLPRTL